ncbi:aldehyde dehydrogenase family protein [Oceanobacillus timonensis]|uniref:aldehyde dehydrogenase family protein n=1 Tax=Oceanobacillus timonensis TaxID=1926285 RepID=UPI0009BA85EE|nr:aldehyde dehydrogenase family protein [Oceanobacillus timonensis]
MYNYIQHYINGQWVDSTGDETIDVINPATEEKIGEISSGTKADLDKAVQAARDAFPAFSQTTQEERAALLDRIADEYEKRKDQFIEVIMKELGSPITFTTNVQYQMGLNHFRTAAKLVRDFAFTEQRENSFVQKDAIGVAGLITPWNFPTNQASTKLASAFAAGSTVVLKPSTETPFAAVLLAEVFEAAGVPKGVFNLVNGTGSTIGNGISSHPDIDFVSFTGSGGVGTKIMENAAQDIKKVSLELGGKSPIVVLDDADVDYAAKTAISNIAGNTGQVCTAGTRALVPESMHDDFIQAIKKHIPEYPVGDPKDESTFTGPQVSKDQWKTVQDYIQKGIDSEATLVTGGTGKPEGLETGYYSQLTVFTNVKPEDTIAQEEIFGPVLSVITYKDLDEAIDIANGTIYGLAGYVVGSNPEALTKAARSLRSGRIVVNNEKADFTAPFGGFNQSGIGREWGDYGIEEFLEPKTIVGLPS